MENKKGSQGVSKGSQKRTQLILMNSKPRLYAIKKYVSASSVSEALELESKTPVHEVFLVNNPGDEEKKPGADAVGFKSMPLEDEDEPQDFRHSFTSDYGEYT